MQDISEKMERAKLAVQSKEGGLLLDYMKARLVQREIETLSIIGEDTTTAVRIGQGRVLELRELIKFIETARK